MFARGKQTEYGIRAITDYTFKNVTLQKNVDHSGSIILAIE